MSPWSLRTWPYLETASLQMYRREGWRDHRGWGWALNPVIVFLEKHTQGRRTWDVGGRDRGNAATNRGCRGLRVEGGRKELLLERSWPCRHSLVSRTARGLFFGCFKPPSLWYFEWHPWETHTGVCLPMVHPGRCWGPALVPGTLYEVADTHLTNEWTPVMPHYYIWHWMIKTYR